MADDKSKRGGPDRRKVAGGEGYEVDYFARKHGITKEQAEGLIKRSAMTAPSSMQPPRN
jgi:hypothetical protein